MDVTTPIDRLPRTASQTLKKFRVLEINSFWDLINYIPSRYDTNPPPQPIDSIEKQARYFDFETTGLLTGETKNNIRVTIRGTILSIKNIFARNGFRIQKGILTDGTDIIELVWYNQIYLLRVLQPGMKLQVVGTVTLGSSKLSIQVSEYEIITNDNFLPLHTAPFTPIYAEKKGISSRVLREKIHIVLPLISGSIDDPLPDNIITSYNLISEHKAYCDIHFPQSAETARRARIRLAFDELFTIQLSSKIIKRSWQHEVAKRQFAYGPEKQKNIEHFISKLPFELTGSQNNATQEIIADMLLKKPMNRLLQGDVGSGKTVVGAVACYLTKLNKFTTLFMAPTEILAEQHYKTLTGLFANYFTTILFTSSKKPTQKEIDTADVIVGTHALIAKKVDFNRIGLVIIDEQHKFGVAQRAELKNKAINPHLLTMTATPIPRTVLLTLYGELDLSVMKELPKYRISIRTYLVPVEKRDAGYEWIIKQVKEHKTQVFIVCPFIEESDHDSIKDVKAAKAEFERLTQGPLSSLTLGLLHGKQTTKEKNEILEKFSENEIQVLVSTPVVEVGIDYPNATIIVIEGAERFGLAQLHQLRGRVGRGNKQSHCLLFSDSNNENTQQRLRIFSKVTNGYELAEYDLKTRGAGDIYGTRQHGISDLKVASLSDFELIAQTDRASDEFLDNHDIKQFTILHERVLSYQSKRIARD